MKSIILIIIFASIHANAAERKLYSFEHLYPIVSHYTHFIDQPKPDISESKNKYDQVLMLGIGSDFTFKWNLLLQPEVFISQEIDIEPGANKRFIIPRLSIAYPWRFLKFHLGTSFIFTRYSGDGGAVQVGGNTFYQPNKTSTSINNTIDLAIDYTYKKAFIRTQLFTFSAFDKERRFYSYSLSGGWYFDLK